MCVQSLSNFINQDPQAFADAPIERNVEVSSLLKTNTDSH